MGAYAELLASVDEDSEPGVLLRAAATGPTFHWRIKRTVSEANHSFSRDALDGLRVSISAWIEARILEHWERTGLAPVDMTVSVKVECRDVSDTTPVQ